MGEGPLRRSLVSVPFLRNSALMLLVSDHWNEKEMVSGRLSPRFPRCEPPGEPGRPGSLLQQLQHAGSQRVYDIQLNGHVGLLQPAESRPQV